MAIDHSTPSSKRRRADFFPNPKHRRRSNYSAKPLAAFQRAALCPKPTGAPKWKDYVGSWAPDTARDLLVALLENVDFLGTRNVLVDDRRGNPWGGKTCEMAFLLVAVPAIRLDQLAEFGAEFSDLEDGGDLEPDENEEAGAWAEAQWSVSGKAVVRFSPTTAAGCIEDDAERMDRHEAVNQEHIAHGRQPSEYEAHTWPEGVDQTHMVIWRRGVIDDDCEADAVEQHQHDDQRHRWRGDNSSEWDVAHDGREFTWPEDRLGDSATTLWNDEEGDVTAVEVMDQTQRTQGHADQDDSEVSP